MNFPTNYASILERLESYDPSDYSKTRNYLDGHVSYLSPYLSRGVISTKQVLNALQSKHEDIRRFTKFIQELAWRDYWQTLWNHHGNQIDSDLKHTQPGVVRKGISKSILNASTGIHQIDLGIKSLYTDGYMHNHMRMYVASIATNLAGSHWLQPAQWMYYHLLDADWASNALSWQWVAGSNSNKKYFANQWNINTFSKSSQHNTFLDVPYEDFNHWKIPAQLEEREVITLKTNLPDFPKLNIDKSLETAIYTSHNLDPAWKNDENLNRILILEPSFFKKYPVSERVMEFTIQLAHNISGIQFFVGEFETLHKQVKNQKTYFKQHPTNQHFKGIEEPRDWMSTVEKPYPSFFGFWKKAQKEIFS